MLPVRSVPPPESARSALSETPSWVWALTRKSTRENSSHPTTARAIHLSTRPGVMPLSDLPG